MNDYLEPYEDMAMILVHLLLLTVSHMNHVHLLLEQNISHIVFFEVVEPFDVQSGYIAPWFGQPGGADQFAVYKYDIYGHIIKNGDEYMRYTINDLMSDDIGVLEDITDKVLKGEIVFE